MSSPPSSRPSSRIALRLFLAVGVPTAVVVIALGLLAWRTTRQAVEASLQRELAAAVTVAASTIRPLALRVLIREDEASSRSYRQIVARLRAIQASTGSVRVLVVDASGKVRASGDPTLHIGDPAPRVALDLVELQRAIAGSAAVSVPFSAQDGRRYMAAYARIPDVDVTREHDDDDAPATAAIDEAPALVLAMEAPAAALDATDDVARQIGGLVALAVLSVVTLALVVARTITRPLSKLARETERLAAGDLKSALVVPPGRDEVASLGRTLESMRQALVDRDAERQMMLAGIAHEVRNPLGGMELFSGLLEEGIAELHVDDAQRRELLEQAGRVRKELRYLTDVVSSFLAFARDTPLAKESVDVHELLEDVASLCRREGGARVVVEPVDGVRVDVDRARIKQALLNLVDNALSASHADGVVTLRASTADGVVKLVVEDTGKGIDADTLERVWTPFFTTKEKGSGLGLPLVRKLARDHGGDARVDSVVGRGTTVTITLPA